MEAARFFSPLESSYLMVYTHTRRTTLLNLLNFNNKKGCDCWESQSISLSLYSSSFYHTQNHFILYYIIVISIWALLVVVSFIVFEN